MKPKRSINKPKILVFIYNPDQIGGPTTAMRLLMNSWLKNNYEFKEIYIEGSIGRKMPFKLLNDLRKEIKNYDPDVIHLTGLQLQAFYATLASRLAGYSNILVVIRGSSTDMIDFPVVKRLIMGKIIEPLTIKMAKIIYTVCQEMAEKPLIKKSNKKFGGVIHNAIPNIQMENYNRYAIKNELELAKKDILLVYTGRVTKEKGVHFALQALRDIKNDNIKLALCGDGVDLEEFKGEYEEEIKNKRLFVLGERKDVINILYGSDIFLFPTLHENLSNSLLEACAVGKPIIATSVGGNPEVITNGVNGLLIPPFSSEDIRHAIEYLVENKVKMKLFGEEAKRLGNKKFSQESIYYSVDRLYKKIMK